MREILFRGKGNKKYNNGDWYFGGGIGTDCDGDCYIQDNSFRWTVIPDTVCQYTGLTDKNGTKIFENDIVTSDDFCPDNEGYGVINWHDDEAMFVVEADNCYYDFDHIYGAELEVIGNIFDNPELIRGVEE
jgi:uncharacterized phage protein (TIGR01671 family)